MTVAVICTLTIWRLRYPKRLQRCRTATFIRRPCQIRKASPPRPFSTASDTSAAIAVVAPAAWYAPNAISIYTYQYIGVDGSWLVSCTGVSDGPTRSFTLSVIFFLSFSPGPVLDMMPRPHSLSSSLGLSSRLLSADLRPLHRHRSAFVSSLLPSPLSPLSSVRFDIVFCCCCFALLSFFFALDSTTTAAAALLSYKGPVAFTGGPTPRKERGNCSTLLFDREEGGSCRGAQRRLHGAERE